jgi:hypothetical protein
MPEGMTQAVAAGTALRIEGGACLDLTLCTVVYTGITRVKSISPSGAVTSQEGSV